MTKLRAIIFVVVTGTLAFILIAVVSAMLIGLFDEKVDNAKIFGILGPAFQMVVGAFVGIIARDALEKVQ